MNERVQLECYQFGDAVGPYSTTLWYRVLNVTRPVNYDGRSNEGFLPTHYVDDGLAGNQVDQGVPACRIDGAVPTPVVAPPVRHESPVQVHGAYIAPGGNLAVKLFAHYARGTGAAVVIDWRWFTPYKAFVNFVHTLQVGKANARVWEAPASTDLYWALGHFSIERTSAHCYYVYDFYDFSKTNPAHYLRGSRTFAEYASGCIY